VENPTAKACTKCREVKPLEAFSPGIGKHKRISQCRDCKRKPRKTIPLPLGATHRDCRKCGQPFPLGKLCLPCKSAAARAWRALHSRPRRAPKSRPQSAKRAPKLRPQSAKRVYSQSPDKDLRRFWELSRRARKLGVQVIDFTLAELGQRAMALGDRCWMCQSAWTDWDHVKPLSKGGAHCLANLRPACGPCNSRKSSTWRGAAWAHSLRNWQKGERFHGGIMSVEPLVATPMQQ